jgi:hypothetical protein
MCEVKSYKITLDLGGWFKYIKKNVKKVIKKKNYFTIGQSRSKITFSMDDRDQNNCIAIGFHKLHLISIQRCGAKEFIQWGHSSHSTMHD